MVCRVWGLGFVGFRVKFFVRFVGSRRLGFEAYIAE